MKNACGKTRDTSHPYEIWQGAGWKWVVLKKYQADDATPFARWLCQVYSPICPNGELGDCDARDIMRDATRTA